MAGLTSAFNSKRIKILEKHKELTTLMLSSSIKFLGENGVPADPSSSNLFSYGAGNTFNLNFGGEVTIVDRSVSDYKPTVNVVKFQAQSGFVANIPAYYIIAVNKLGQVLPIPSGLVKLPNYSATGIDANNLVQLGVIDNTQGVINPGGSGALYQDGSNIYNKYMSLTDALGPVNLKSGGIDIFLNAGTTNLGISAGKVHSRNAIKPTGAGFTTRTDIIEVPQVVPSLILTANRLNQVIGAGITVNTTQYEPTAGSIQLIPNGQLCTRYLVAFPSNQYLGYIYGQYTYNNNADGLRSSQIESTSYPSLAASGVPLRKLIIIQNEVNFDAVVENVRFLRLNRLE